MIRMLRAPRTWANDRVHHERYVPPMAHGLQAGVIANRGEIALRILELRDLGIGSRIHGREDRFRPTRRRGA